MDYSFLIKYEDGKKTNIFAWFQGEKETMKEKIEKVDNALMSLTAASVKFKKPCQF